MSGRPRGRVVHRATGVVVLCLSMAEPASSHDVRPALLQITERLDHHYDVLWKQPNPSQIGILIPDIGGGLLDQPPSEIEAVPSFEIRVWRNVTAGTQGLEGRILRIDGLEQSTTDVLVSIVLIDGGSIQEVLHPKNPGLTVHLHQPGLAVPAYLPLGIEHILTGGDHLAFVLALMLLVRRWITLIKTITAFTVAHSITLAATALHVIAVRPSAIEALVALSIFFVAVELARSYRGKTGLTARYPWLIAFTFGLLHGAAFAGALTEIGLPPHAIPLSLLLFNIGVELGQLLFIGVVLAIAWALTLLPRTLPVWTRWAPPYAIGSFAAFWFVDRVHTALV